MCVPKLGLVFLCGDICGEQCKLTMEGIQFLGEFKVSFREIL